MKANDPFVLCARAEHAVPETVLGASAFPPGVQASYRKPDFAGIYERPPVVYTSIHLGVAIFGEVHTFTVRFEAKETVVHFTSFKGSRPANGANDLQRSIARLHKVLLSDVESGCMFKIERFGFALAPQVAHFSFQPIPSGKGQPIYPANPPAPAGLPEFQRLRPLPQTAAILML